MNIINILKGIENLAVELLLWIIYIPKTIFKIIKDPFWVSDYVDSELKKEDKFTNYMSPVLLYLGTTVILFVIADMIGSTKEKNFLEEIQSIKGLLFLLLPLLLALTVEIFRKGPFNRYSVLRGLYIQCYYLSPLMLALFAFSITDAFQYSTIDWNSNALEDSGTEIIPSFLFLLTLLWFVIVEVKFISKDLPTKKLKAFFIFITSYLVLGFAGLIYFIVSDTDVNKNLVAEPETYDFTLTETAEYTISINDVSDFEIYDNYYSIALEKISNSSDEKRFDRSSTSMDTQINLIHGQFYNGPISEYRPHVFRGIEGDVVGVGISMPIKSFGENPTLKLYIGNIANASNKEFLSSPLMIFDDSTPETRYAEFSLPSTGQFSFYLNNDVNIIENEEFYGLSLSIYDNENTSYPPEIRYNETYEGSFFSNEGDWKFKGKKGDNLILTVNSPDADISFNIFKDGISIIPIHNEKIIPFLRGLYILSFGYAVLIGFRAFFRKKKKEELQLDDSKIDK